MARKLPLCTPAWICGATSEHVAALLAKPLAWLVCGAPLLWLLWAIAQEVQQPGSALGADPGEAVVLYLGEWGIRMLLLALAVSPLRRLLGWASLVRVRRLVGLFAFTYLSLHFLAYLGFLAGFEWTAILEDLTERSYITAGALGLLALLPLTITSTRGWQRRLGRRWRGLHRLVFVAAALGLVHLLWLTKDGYGEVLAYGAIFLVLMAERFSQWRHSHGRSGETILRTLQRGLSGGSGV
jgi:sulfoxide reductase heme-binding subunit YedZ